MAWFDGAFGCDDCWSCACIEKRCSGFFRSSLFSNGYCGRNSFVRPFCFPITCDCLSELADFAVYTPMRKHFPAFSVVMAGLVGSIIDSAIFLSLAFGSIEFIEGQVLGKFWMSLLAGMVIRYLRPRLAPNPKF